MRNVLKKLFTFLRSQRTITKIATGITLISLMLGLGAVTKGSPLIMAIAALGIAAIVGRAVFAANDATAHEYEFETAVASSDG